MPRRSQGRGKRGFLAIGLVHSKTKQNVGTLLRSASLYEVAFVFTVGHRYQRQASDTLNTPLHTPLFHFATVDDLVEHLPQSCPLVGVELDPRAFPLGKFTHPERACYLLGAEDHGLSMADRDRGAWREGRDASSQSTHQGT